MRIVNRTHWDTRAIMKLIYRVAQDELQPGQLKRRGHVYLHYIRSNGRSLGWCYYGTPRNPRVEMRLALPRHGAIDPVQLAKVIAHELAHSRGLKHRHMHNNRYGWLPGWKERYAYAQEFLIDIAVSAIPVPRHILLEKRRRESITKAQRMVRKWETSMKRANTMLKKWKIRLKAAEKRIAKAPD